MTTLDDSRTVSNVLAVAAFVAGVGTLVLQTIGGYATPSTSTAEVPSLNLQIFLVSWSLLVAGYLFSRRLTSPSVGAFVYLATQLILVAACAWSSGRGVGALVLFVIWGAQGIHLFPQRWPVVVLVAGTTALVTMSRSPTEPAEVVTIVTVLLLIVMTTYLISHVRGTLVRRQARELLRELSATRGELNGFASQVEEAVLVDERQRMARELHDTLAQGLVGVTLQLEAADMQLEKGSAGRARQIVLDAMARARDSLADARLAIYDLRRGGDRDDFDSVVRHEVERFEKATGITCRLDLDLDLPLNRKVAEVAARVVSEGLTNIARHAQATNAEVTISNSANGLLVRVVDDGVGVAEEETAAAGHYGVLGLQERARKLGGTVRLSNRANRGTELAFTMNESNSPHGDAQPASYAVNEIT